MFCFKLRKLEAARYLNIVFHVSSAVGFGHQPRVIIDSSKVPEMKEIKVTDHGLVFGSFVTLSEMEEVLQETIEQLPGRYEKYMVQ